MPVTLKLQKVTSPIQDEDRAVIFYTKNYSYIFRDQYGRQLSFTRQEFENIRPSLEYAEERLLELQPNQGQARITYDFAHYKFKLTYPNAAPKFDPVPHYGMIAPILRKIKKEAQNIRLYPLQKPTTNQQKNFKERIADISKPIQDQDPTNDFEQFMKNLCAKKPIIHLTNPDLNNLDYAQLKQQAVIFISLKKGDHSTGLIFDQKNQRGYYYDPAGKDIDHQSCQPAKDIYEAIKRALGINTIQSNHTCHQDASIHGTRYLMNFYLHFASLPDQFDFNSFCADENKNIRKVIQSLLESQGVSLQQSQKARLTGSKIST